METFFDHGLFATKSVLVFVVLWLAGTVTFEFANRGHLGFHVGSKEFALMWPKLQAPVLVLESLPVSSIVVRASSEPVGPAMLIARPFEETATEIACGDQIEPLWYALDVFVPLLDLRQEEKCSMSSRGGAWAWRAFKPIYAILGAVVTSLMLLTVSGVLRRRVEQ
jgi:hypothetical protein